MRWLIIIAIAPFLAFAQNPPVPLSQNALGTVAQILNSSSTGTTLNKLASLTGAPSKVVITTAGATGGVVGIVASGAGTAGTATVQVTGGSVPCVFDGSTTAGDYVQISASVNGDCADAGSTLPSSGQVIGRVLTTNSGVGTYKIDLNAGGGGGSSSGGGNTTICNGSASATAATCPGVPAPTTYGLGTTASPYLSGTFIPGATSSGAPLTLNIAGLGAKNVFVGGVATSASNTVTSGTPYSFQYDGTQIQVLSGGGGGSSASVFCAATMSTNALTCTPSTALTSYTNAAIYFTVSASNTGPVTLDASGLGAKNVLWSGLSLPTGFFSTGITYIATFDGTSLNVAASGGFPMTTTVAGLPTLGTGSNRVNADMTTWTQSGSVVGSGTDISYRVTASAGNSVHYAFKAPAFSTSGTYVWTFKVKAGTVSNVAVIVSTNVADNNFAFDLANMVTSGPDGGTAGWSSYINPVPATDGFYSCTILFTATSSISFVLVSPQPTYGFNAGANYTATGTEYVEFLSQSVLVGTSLLPPVNTYYMVTDGISVQDCTVGGGSTRSQCRFTASAAGFIPLVAPFSPISSTSFVRTNTGLGNQAVYIGDSLTANNYGLQVTTTQKFSKHILGVGGRTALTIIGYIPSNVCQLYTTGGQWNIAIPLAGVNDIDITNADSAANIEGYITAIHRELHQCGFQTLALTITPCGTATCTVGFNAIITTIDNWIRANWRTFADAFIDIAATANMSDPTNTTYYNADQEHWTATGITYVASVVGPGINVITNPAPPAISGACSVSAAVGNGLYSGGFTSGTTGACVFTLTFPVPGNGTGYFCLTNNLTTGVSGAQTATATTNGVTTAGLTVATTATNLVNFGCSPY